MPEQNKKTEDDKSELINIEWSAMEFEQQEKSRGWFITAGIIALALFTISLIMENFIFSFLIILIVFIIFIYAIKKPKLIKFKINGRGLTVDNNLYAFDDLKSFWIFYEPPQLKELSVKSKKIIMPLIKVPLAEQDPVEIRQALINFIPEERQEQSLADALARYFRF